MKRRHVFTMLERTLGPEAAESMMELLPFQCSTDLVTRSDRNATTVLLQGQMAELRSDLQGQMTGLRNDLQGQMTGLRSELRGEMADIRGEMRAL